MCNKKDKRLHHGSRKPYKIGGSAVNGYKGIQETLEKPPHQPERQMPL